MAKGFPQIMDSMDTKFSLGGYSQVLINKIMGKKIILKWGVGQGDSLSLYLFILAFDILIVWIQKMTITRAWEPQLHNSFNCLLYIVDSIFIFKSQLRQFHILKSILTIFLEVTGLKLNM
jgi:hypothetical protein